MFAFSSSPRNWQTVDNAGRNPISGVILERVPNPNPPSFDRLAGNWPWWASFGRVFLGWSGKAAEDALGEQVLDEHLFDGVIFEVGVDGFAADIGEGGEALDESLVGFALGRDELHGSGGYVGDFDGELADCIFPFLDVGLAVFEEISKDFDELFRGGDVVVECDDAVLVESGVGG